MRNFEENYFSRILLDLVKKSLNGTSRVTERILNNEFVETVSDKKNLFNFDICSLSLSYKIVNHVLNMID